MAFLISLCRQKAYVEEIIKQNKSIKNILSQIYHKCIKEAFKEFVVDYKRKNIKNLKFLAKIKAFTSMSVKFLTALSIPFLPKFILYPILKMLSDVNFYILKKNHKVKKRRQKYNF